MHKLVLLRHGEAPGTGRTGSPAGPTSISPNAGRDEAQEAGRLLREGGYVFDLAYTSVLKRAIRTLWIALDALDLMWIPVEKDWRLNERHYGALQGLNKAETAAKHGEAQIENLAAQLRHSAAAARRRTTARTRRAIRATPALQPDELPLHRIAERHGRALPALLARDDRARRSGPGKRVADRRARQQPARARQVSRRRLRIRHRRAEHPDRHSAGLRAGRAVEADSPLLSGRSGGRGGRGRARGESSEKPG